MKASGAGRCEGCSALLHPLLLLYWHSLIRRSLAHVYSCLFVRLCVRVCSCLFVSALVCSFVRAFVCVFVWVFVCVVVVVVPFDQSHPARDAHDTFFIKDPASAMVSFEDIDIDILHRQPSSTRMHAAFFL